MFCRNLQGLTSEETTVSFLRVLDLTLSIALEEIQYVLFKKSRRGLITRRIAEAFSVSV